MRDVHFAHADAQGRAARALADVSFVAHPATITALVGPSAAVKSTALESRSL
jgi:ABC-type multidrug transport system fused ATPase/permease subunit